MGIKREVELGTPAPAREAKRGEEGEIGACCRSAGRQVDWHTDPEPKRYSPRRPVFEDTGVEAICNREVVGKSRYGQSPRRGVGNGPSVSQHSSVALRRRLLAITERCRVAIT